MLAMPGVLASSAYQLRVSSKEVAVMNTSQSPNLVFAATKGPVFVHQDITTGNFASRGVSKLAGPSFAMMTPPIQPRTLSESDQRSQLRTVATVQRVTSKMPPQ